MVTSLTLHQPDPVIWPWGTCPMHVPLLHGTQNRERTDNLCDNVRNYKYLSNVSISLVVPPLPVALPLSSQSSTFHDDNAPQQNPFAAFSTTIQSILRNVTSEYIHTISIRIAPSLCLKETTATRITSEFTYRSTRRRALELLFPSDVVDIFAWLPLCGLAKLHLSVQENSLGYDAEWWCAALRDRLGNAPHEIRVHVDYCMLLFLLHLRFCETD